jgi:hypothetical protein
MPGYGVGDWGGHSDDEEPVRPPSFADRVAPVAARTVGVAKPAIAHGPGSLSLAEADAAITAAKSGMLKAAEQLPEYKALEAEITRQEKRDGMRGNREIDSFSRDNEKTEDQLALSAANTALSTRLEAAGVSKGNLESIMSDLNKKANHIGPGVAL